MKHQCTCSASKATNSSTTKHGEKFETGGSMHGREVLLKKCGANISFLSVPYVAIVVVEENYGNVGKGDTDFKDEAWA